MSQPGRAATVLLGILTTVLVGWTLHVGAEILQPLVIALLLAIILQPVVRGLARFHVPPFLTVAALVALIFFGLAQVGLTVQKSIASFVGEAGGWSELVNGVEQRLHASHMPPTLAQFVADSLRNLDVQGLATDLIGGGVGFGKSLILVVIYMLFIFAEQAIFRRKILSIAGDRREEAAEVLDTIGTGIQRYLGVKTIVSLLTGVLCYAVLQYLEIPYARLWGVLTFVLNYIPTFGSIIAGIFPTVTAMVTPEGSWSTALLVAFTYLAVNLALGSFLEPKILGRQLDLSPLVIVLSVVVWAGIWGVVGAFLAVPITSSLQLVLASRETTRPIAILLSSGPPRERRLVARLASRKAAAE